MPFEVILLRAFSCENARKPAEFGAEALGRGAFPRIDVDFVKAIALVVSSRRALSMMGREATLFGTANDGDSHWRSRNGNSHGPRCFGERCGGGQVLSGGLVSSRRCGVRSVKGLGRRWVRASNEGGQFFSRPVVRRGV